MAFGGASVPAPTPTPPAPTVDDAQMRIDEARRRRSRGGRASTQLVQNEGSVSTAARQLTGN